MVRIGKQFSALHVGLAGVEDTYAIPCIRSYDDVDYCQYVDFQASPEWLAEAMQRAEGPLAYLQLFHVDDRVRAMAAFGLNPTVGLLQVVCPVDGARHLVFEEYAPGYWYPRARLASEFDGEPHESVARMLDKGGVVGLKAGFNLPRGYCYLMLFPPSVWVEVRQQLGRSPSSQAVYEHELRYRGGMLSALQVDVAPQAHLGAGPDRLTEGLFSELVSLGCTIGHAGGLDVHAEGLGYLAAFPVRDHRGAFRVLGRAPVLAAVLQYMSGFVPAPRVALRVVQVQDQLVLVNDAVQGVAWASLVQHGADHGWGSLPLSGYSERVKLSADQVTSVEAASMVGAEMMTQDGPGTDVFLGVPQTVCVAAAEVAVGLPEVELQVKVVKAGRRVGYYSALKPGVHAVCMPSVRTSVRLHVSGAVVEVPTESGQVVIDTCGGAVVVTLPAASTVVFKVPRAACLYLAAARVDLSLVAGGLGSLLFSMMADVVTWFAGPSASADLTEVAWQEPQVEEFGALKRYMTLPFCGKKRLSSLSESFCMVACGDYPVDVTVGCVSVNLCQLSIGVLDPGGGIGIWVESANRYAKCGALSIGDMEIFATLYDPSTSPPIGMSRCSSDSEE